MQLPCPLHFMPLHWLRKTTIKPFSPYPVFFPFSKGLPYLVLLVILSSCRLFNARILIHQEGKELVYYTRDDEAWEWQDYYTRNKNQEPIRLCSTRSNTDTVILGHTWLVTCIKHFPHICDANDSQDYPNKWSQTCSFFDNNKTYSSFASLQHREGKIISVKFQIMKSMLHHECRI